MKRTINRNNIKIKSSSKAKKAFWGAFCMVLFAATVFVTIESATSSSELAQINIAKSEIRGEIEELNSKLVKGSSLNELSQKAQGIGFAKPGQIVYIGKPADVASRIQ